MFGVIKYLIKNELKIGISLFCFPWNLGNTNSLETPSPSTNRSHWTIAFLGFWIWFQNIAHFAMAYNKSYMPTLRLISSGVLCKGHSSVLFGVVSSLPRINGRECVLLLPLLPLIDKCLRSIYVKLLWNIIIIEDILHLHLNFL